MVRFSFKVLCVLVITYCYAHGMERSSSFKYEEKHEVKDKKKSTVQKIVAWLKESFDKKERKRDGGQSILVRSSSTMNSATILMNDLFRAIENNDFEAVKRLNAFTLDINYREPKTLYTPLMKAILNLYAHKQKASEEKKARAIVGLLLSEKYWYSIELYLVNKHGQDAFTLAKKYKLEKALSALRSVDALQEMSRNVEKNFTDTNSLFFKEFIAPHQTEVLTATAKNEQENSEDDADVYNEKRKKLIDEIREHLSIDESFQVTEQFSKKKIVTPYNSLYPINKTEIAQYQPTQSLFGSSFVSTTSAFEVTSTNNNNNTDLGSHSIRHRSATISGSRWVSLEKAEINEKKEEQGSDVTFLERPSRGGSSSDDELFSSSKSKKKETLLIEFQSERKKSTGSSSHSDLSEKYENKKNTIEKK